MTQSIQQTHRDRNLMFCSFSGTAYALALWQFANAAIATLNPDSSNPDEAEIAFTKTAIALAIPAAAAVTSLTVKVAQSVFIRYRDGSEAAREFLRETFSTTGVPFQLLCPPIAQTISGYLTEEPPVAHPEAEYLADEPPVAHLEAEELPAIDNDSSLPVTDPEAGAAAALVAAALDSSIQTL